MLIVVGIAKVNNNYLLCLKMKECATCHKILPEKEFYRRGAGKINTCKKCISKRNRKYRHEHKERVNEASRKYHHEHKEHLNEISRKYHHEHKEEENKNRRKYHQKHKDKENRVRREYWQKNKDKINKERRKNRMKHHKVEKIYKQKNKDKVNQQNRKRRLKKNQLFEDFTLDEWIQKIDETKGICPICNKSYSEISPFCATIDHTPPISKAPVGFHYTINDVIPMCGSCNSSKNCY